LGPFFPREVPARNYKMGCRKTKGGTRDPNIYEFEVGRRIKFVFKLNEAFSKRYGFR
jgi:hypothetical protein